MYLMWLKSLKKDKMLTTDICILGAGPAGATTALYLDKMGISSVLIDKATFPRHKTCGEAMRVNVHFVLKDLNPDYLEEIEQEKIVLRSQKVRAIATNGKDLTVNLGRAFCYMGKRYDFDNYLISKVKSKSNIQFIENQSIHKIIKNENGYLVSNKLNNFQVQTKLIVFANGSNSTLHTQLNHPLKSTDKQILGVRAYLKSVHFPDSTTHIYFFEELHGGYLWVFPLPDGEANVGLAMKSDKIQAHGINIRETFKTILKHDRLKPFLKDATINGGIGGATVNLPTMGQSLSGEGYLLAGDIGLAINPITGLGVGHAMMMGRYAAKQAERCLSANDFSATIMKNYDTEIYKMIGDEVKGGLWLTNLLKKTWLVNGMIRFFGSNKRFRKLFEKPELSHNLNNPKYLLKELLKPS
ncbi:MAG: geranylgeranyl reductase family protein [Cognaticolwellia sp.]|jgi:geranylgeranyl reductase family protein